MALLKQSCADKNESLYSYMGKLKLIVPNTNELIHGLEIRHILHIINLIENSLADNLVNLAQK